MKISKQTFIDYLHKISMSDGAWEARVDFAAEGIIARVMNPAQHYFCFGKLDASAIENYKAVGEIGVKDLKKLKGFAARFRKDIILNVRENTFTMRDPAKHITVTLADKEFIDKVPELGLEYIILFEIPTAELRDCAADSKAFAEDKKPVIELAIDKEGAFIMTARESLESDEKIRKKIKTEVKNQEALAKFDAKFFRQIVGCLTAEKVTLYLKSNYPLQIKEIDNKMKMIFHIAPITPEDTKTESAVESKGVEKNVMGREVQAEESQ